jgi:adenosylcobinamide-phosphate synthase
MLVGSSLLQLTVMILIAVVLDALFGEVCRAHPLVGFGYVANWIEGKMNRCSSTIGTGLTAWTVIVIPPTLLCFLVVQACDNALANIGLQATVLYFCIGLRSLRDHTRPITVALAADDIDTARKLTAQIVSRDTKDATSSEIAKAASESLLENGNDAVFGTLFWFVVAGAPGALLFRLANTLDAMWGYRTSRFNLFGRVAAKMDDVLNWLPARLTACSYVLVASKIADKKRAWHCWQQQAPAWPSPNAGPVMASGAGALGIGLGGVARYNGIIELRPPLGIGPAADHRDIERAWRLVLGTTGLWLLLLVMASSVSEWTVILSLFNRAHHA